LSQFRLKRTYPTTLEITVTPSQIIQMFPVELQEHPSMGIIKRVWKTEGQIYSVDAFPEDAIEDLSGSRKYLRLKDEYMKQLLSEMNRFQIILYYQDKEDVYFVERLNN